MKRILPVVSFLFLFTSYVSADEPVQALDELPALGAALNQTSVSGLSSGGFMAAQIHVAYSESFIGAGIVAGGPWNCAQSLPENPFIPPITNAVTTCMNPCKFYGDNCPSAVLPHSSYLAVLAKDEVVLGNIDPIKHLADDQVYIFSGQSDETVITEVVDQTSELYRKLGVAEEAIVFDKNVNAGHAFITADPADTRCDVTQTPYINNCDFWQSEKILSHIYGELSPAVAAKPENLVVFNQQAYVESELSSMDELAYVYIPERCREGGCKVHVAIHGCLQGAQVIGTEYITKTAYNQVAESNGIIVLYPQVHPSKISPLNPEGCWDFWGYTTNNLPPYNYFKQDAPQMKAIMQMVARLQMKP